MRLDYAPAVQGDFNEAIAHYEAAGGTHLADRFETEFRAGIAAIKSGPTQFSFYQKHSFFRRIRLKNFPISSSIGKHRTASASSCSSMNAAIRSSA